MISANPDEKFHASAPVGYKCADCRGADPCPLCYQAWWSRKNPNVVQLPAASAAPAGAPVPVGGRVENTEAYCSACATYGDGSRIFPAAKHTCLKSDALSTDGQEGWHPIPPKGAEFVLGSWVLPDGTREVGEVYEDGPDYWLDIMGGSHKTVDLLFRPLPPAPAHQP